MLIAGVTRKAAIEYGAMLAPSMVAFKAIATTRVPRFAMDAKTVETILKVAEDTYPNTA